MATEILEDVRKEAEAAIIEAEKEGKDILRTAKDEANNFYITITNEAKTKAEAERRRIKSLTEVETRNSLLQKKEQLVNAAFDRALDQLTDFTKTKDYPAYLRELIKEASSKLNSKNLVLYLNSADSRRLTKKDLTKLSEELGVELTLAENPGDYIGGCKLQTKDKKILYDNTVESRLQQLKPFLRIEVAKVLFGKEEEKNAN